MNPVNMRVITKKQLLQGMNLALKNARRLLKEANILYQRRAYSRAFVLAVLALEEAGKVVFLTLCFSEERFEAPESMIRNFWRLYTSHIAKVAFFEDYNGSKWKSVLYVRKRKHKDTAEFIRKVIKPLMRAIEYVYDYLEEAGISSIGELKLKCLYVDVSENDLNFKLPYDVPPKVAKGMILIADNQISDTSTLRDFFRRAKTGRLSDDILAITVRDQEIRQILDELSQT